ncbi:MAG: hypothetical protein ACPG5B_10820 [Chitinophagales bacterium]
MTKIKRTKAQETIQQYFLKGKTNITEKEFKNLRIKLTNGVRDLGNLRIKKAFLSGGYSLKLINSKKDLDGIPFLEKTDFLRKIVSKWDNDITYISYDEIKEFNIFTTDSIIKIGNFILETGILFGSKYDIRLKDTKKDALGRWKDNEVTIKKIIVEIKKLETDLKEVDTERAFQKLIYDYLSRKFHSVDTEVSIGDLKTTKIDVEVGKSIGIELKMAKGLLKSSELHRTIGQITYEYAKKYNKNKLILLVAGNESLRTQREIKEIAGIVKKQKSHFYFFETK